MGEWFVSNFHPVRLLAFNDKSTVMIYNKGCREILRPRRKKPVTTVTVWFGEEPSLELFVKLTWETRSTPPFKGSYTFRGLPDVDRVIRETLEQGALAIKIECTGSFNFRSVVEKSCYIFDRCIGELGRTWKHEDNEKYLGWHNANSIIHDSDIEVSITKRLKSPKPSVTVVSVDRKGNVIEPDKVELIDGGYRVTHTMTKEEMDAGNCTISMPSKEIDFDLEIIKGSEQKLPKPFHMGQIVARCDILLKVRGMDTAGMEVVTKDGNSHWHKYDLFRPATEAEIDEFYICELAGEPVRAYETDIGNIRLQFTYYHSLLVEEALHVACTLLDFAHIPIMPWSEVQRLYNGEFKPPKGEK
jgi:hypothetical protein